MNDYKQVQWMGGPRDGETIMVRRGIQRILYPHQVDILSMGKSQVPVEQYLIPIRTIEGKEFLMWNERS